MFSEQSVQGLMRWFRRAKRSPITTPGRNKGCKARRLTVNALEDRTCPSSFGYVMSLGGSGNDEGIGIAVDAAGNTYVTGAFQGTVDFDPGPGVFNLTSAGGYDAFVAKYDNAGNFVWARGMGGSSSDAGLGIAVDGAGNVYTTGYFLGTADFDPSPGVFNFTSAGSSDAFVSKLDSAGNFVWARQFGGPHGEAGQRITVDGADNVYTTGYFDADSGLGTVDFDPGPGVYNLTSVGDHNTFVSKLDSAGNFVWARALDSSTDDGQSIAVDGAGNVYTTGNFTGTADFDPGPGVFNLTSAGGSDVFVWKLDSAGNFVWARQLGGSSFDGSYGLALDGAGNVYTTGYFNGTADFDPGAGVFNLTSAGNNDAFVSKLDSAGNFVWARAMGGSGTDVGNGIAVDGTGAVSTIGYFNGTADFDPGAGVFNLTSAGSDDVFVSTLDNAGNFISARALGGSNSDIGQGIAVDGAGNAYATGYTTSNNFPATYPFLPANAGGLDVFVAKITSSFGYVMSLGGSGNDEGIGIAVDAAGNTYVTGAFQGTVDFDPGPGVFNLTSAGGYDAFVAKYDNAGNFVWARGMGGSSSDAGLGIAVDGAGNVYTTGYFLGTADFDPSPGVFNFTSAGSSDAFVSKLDSAGNFVWARQFGGPHGEAGQRITVDGADNVYTTGYFDADSGLGTVDFDPGPGVYNLTSVGDHNTFVSKLDSAGNFVWARALDSSTDDGQSIAVDGAGNVYTTGNFTGTADFDPGPGVFNLTSAGGSDVFVWKLDSAGNFVWARQLGGSSFDGSYGLALDGAGNVYTTGYFNGTADFDPGAGVFNLTSAGNNDAFVSKLDSAGNFVWARAMGGSGTDVGNGIAVDGTGAVSTIGYFNGTADFDPGAGVFNLTSAGSDDVFVSTLDNAGNFISARALGGSNSDIGQGIAVDGAGNAYATGYTTSNNFPATYPFLPANAGGLDVFVAKITAPPRVANVRVNDGSAQRSRVTSLRVDFDSFVALPANPASAFQLLRQVDNGLVGLTAVVSTDTVTHVTLTFNGAITDFGSLQDGRYTLTVLAGSVYNSGGSLDGNGDSTGGDDYQLVGAPGTGPNLFRLYGDVNGDGAVAANDFVGFRGAFGAVLNSSNDIFDFDGDGFVSTNDFVQFRNRFNTSI
jgi:Beta-propeller repeat/Dockerin type I domain